MNYRVTKRGGKKIVWRGELKLETVDTERQAVRALHQWENRDKLEEEIEDFINEMVERYTQKNDPLEETEIRQMIQGI